MNVVLLSVLGLNPYRTVEGVESFLEPSVFQACKELSEGRYTVRFSIRSDGKAVLVEGEACFSSIEDIAFAQSPTSNDMFIWDVIHQDGVLFPQLLQKESPEVIFPGIFAQDKKKLLQEAGKKNAE